jgi:hypothetical protein
MRCFELVRHADPSGVSGTGVVAYGVQFADGVVALRWSCARPATSIWDNVDDLLSVHGHGGRTVVRWLDAAPGVDGLATLSGWRSNS